MTNENNVANSIETSLIPYPEIFGDSTDRHEMFVDAVAEWAALAAASDSVKLSRLAEG